MNILPRTSRGTMKVSALLFAFTLVSFAPAAAPPAAAQAGARVWLDNSSEYLRRGERLDIRFTVPRDAYVAVVHIDPDGALDFLFPSSPWRSEFVRGGRIHTLPTLGSTSRYVRSSSGIGYLYLIASPYPLDFSFFRGAVGSGWYWGSQGRFVHGDPFLAFDQITRLMVPGWPSGIYGSDYFGYYVGGFHNYPIFACSDRYYGSGWGWTTSYGPCGRQEYFLSQYPYYYDTRRYVGDRRVLLRQYERLEPAHRYKEDPEAVTRVAVPARGAVSGTRDGFMPDGSAGRTPLGEPAPRSGGTPAARGQSGQVGSPAAGQDRTRPVPSSARPTTSQGGAPSAAPAPAPSSRPARGSGGNATPSRSGGASGGGGPSTSANSGRGGSAPAAAPAPSRRP